jgi:hypothetical protein
MMLGNQWQCMPMEVLEAVVESEDDAAWRYLAALSQQ